MAIDPLSAISINSGGIDPTQAAALNNNQITAMLVNGNIEPRFATLLLNQMTENNVNSILFGSDTEQENTDIFGMGGLVPNNLQGTSTMNTNDVFGAGAYNNISPQFELSVYSSLIGKTVIARNPMDGQQIEGVVKSVALENGRVVLAVNGINIPTENMIRIKPTGG